MKKYFVCSDIHGFYKEWINSLKKAGFDENNDEHILIVLGDIFDRGKEPYKIYKFLHSLPQERLILVKGNHEYLLLELVKRKSPFEYDYHNGTYQTLISLYKDPWKEFLRRTRKDSCLKNDFEAFKRIERKLYTNKRINEIVEWLQSPQWLNYYELGQYILVHSFIPLAGTGEILKRYVPDWRYTATKEMWEEATWGCPYRLYQLGKFDEELAKGKILVCGHWHTSDFYNHLLFSNDSSKKLNIDEDNPIFKSPEYPGLIGLDACTVLTKTVNVLVIEEKDIG